jgi:methylmalonyl-CoA mutase
MARNRAGRKKPRPEVFLCNLGGLREYKARADFSRGFFAAGGYEVVSPEGFKTPEAAAAAFVKSKARIAVICSTDENYPALVPPLVKALRAGQPDAVIALAGYPPDQIEAHKQAGVDEFIHVRADAVELLAKFHSRLGIEA